MAIYKQDIVDINLNAGMIHRSFLNHTIGTADSHADKFGVRVFRDGVPVELNGVAIQGFFRNPMGQNIALTNEGEINGNVATVTLPPACYNYEGQFTLSLKLIGEGVTGTMRIVDGKVSDTNTTDPVAPTEDIPSYEEIIELYEEMQDTLENLRAYERKMNYVPIDLLSDVPHISWSNNGVDFSWNSIGTEITATGTPGGTTGAYYYMITRTDPSPAWLVPGNKIFLQCDSGNKYLRFGLGFYDSGNNVIMTKSAGYDFEITVPDNAAHVAVFVVALNGHTFANDKISNIGLFQHMPSDALQLEIDSNMTAIRTALANDGLYAFEFVQGNVDDPTGDVYTQNDFIVTKEPVYFSNEFLQITVAGPYKGYIYFKDQNGTNVTRSFDSGVHFFYGGKFVPVRFALIKGNNVPIIPEESWAMTIRKIEEAEIKEIGGGINEHLIVYDKQGNITAGNLYYKTSDGTMYASIPVKIPESGIRIGYNPKYHSKTYIDGTDFHNPSFNIIAVRKGDNGLVLQDDDEDLLAVSGSITTVRTSVYIPYVENCYIIIRQNKLSVPEPTDDYSDALYVTSGRTKGAYGGVYNIFPTGLRINPEMAGFEDKNSLDIFGAQSSVYSYSSMMYYATVVKLRDVNKIVCGPKYTIMAEIYRINNDDTITRETDIYGTWDGTSETGQTSTSGVSVIDFRNYDWDGFALVAIQSTIIYKKTDTEMGYTVRKLTTGNLGGYEDVKANLFVDYKNGVRISEVPGMPSILEENIHRMCNWKIPEYGDGFFVESASTTPHYFPTQYNCVPSMYNGGFIYNSLLMNITAKSALTCVKNRNGRMRKMQRVEGENATLGNIGYGLTCTNFTSVIRGLKENYPAVAWALQNLRKFDRFDFDYRTDLDILRPGDVLVKHIERPALGRPSDSHCMTVSSIVTVNGVVKAVNIIEATIPYCRYATYIDEEYYMDQTNWIVKMYTMDKLEDFKWVCRIKPEYLKQITKTFDLYPDSTEVGTVMCDRGTESIYGIHTKYVELSVSDDEATKLMLYKNGTKIADISLVAAEIVHGLRMVNIYQYISGAGTYTVKTDQSNDVQETFYVQGDVGEMTYTEDEVTTNLTIPDMTGFLFIEVWNYLPTHEDMTEEEIIHRRATRRARIYLREDFTIDPVTNVGTISIPRYQYNFQGEQEDITTIYRVYETEHGTYWASMSGRVSTDHYTADDD